MGFKQLNLILICVFSFLTFSAPTNSISGNKNMTNNLFWYQGTCHSAEVTFHNIANKEKTTKLIHISDSKVIKQITDLLDKLPTSGDIMVSMGPTSVTRLTLNCNNLKYEIQFFGDRIKTPGTSFFSGERAEEKELYHLLKMLN
jgi:hypothetical protein